MTVGARLLQITNQSLDHDKFHYHGRCFFHKTQLSAMRTPERSSQVRHLADRLRHWARRIKRDAVTLWFACRNAKTPRAVKLLCLFVVAYALSPIDLIPDFIPVLGYLDDVLLPGMIWLAVRLLPPAVLEDSRLRAEAWMTEQGRKPVSKVGAAVIVLLNMSHQECSTPRAPMRTVLGLIFGS